MINPDYTVNVQTCDDAKTLYYKVSVTDVNSKVVQGFLHKTENYDEALIYAKVFFDELVRSSSVVASYIEQPYKLVEQGALYSIGSFVGAVPNEDRFYNSLSAEFVERCRREGRPDFNTIFRRMVARHKLNLYKESRFLKRLQQLGIVDKTDNDNEYWVEE